MNPDPSAVQFRFSKRELLALGCVLELRASRDLHALGSGNLNGFASTWVATGARGTGGLLERDPARDGDLVIGTSHVTGNDFEHAADSGIDVRLAHLGLRSDGDNQFRLIHGYSLGHLFEPGGFEQRHKKSLWD